MDDCTLARLYADVITPTSAARLTIDVATGPSFCSLLSDQLRKRRTQMFSALNSTISIGHVGSSVVSN